MPKMYTQSQKEEKEKGEGRKPFMLALKEKRGGGASRK